MFKKLFFSFFLLTIGSVLMNKAHAYEHEVWKSGDRYYWKTFDVERGSSTSLTTAIEGAMGSGNRDIHIVTGGSLDATINVSATDVRLYCHNNTFTRDFSGSGILNTYDGFEIHDMILRGGSNGYGIRSSRASHLKFINVQIYDCPWIGIRVDSRESNPWNYWISDLEVKNCRFENIGDHALETYSINGVDIDNIVVRTAGGCGVLLNRTTNGTLGTVDAYRCNYGGGYAGLRLANDCSNITTEKLIARECGRGYFVLSGSNNSHLNNAEITDCTDVGIWLENVVNCSVKAGCNNSGTAVSGSGSYANVTNSCSSNGGGGSYVQFQNRATGLFLDGMGRTGNGDACGLYANTTHQNSHWELVDAGSGYYRLRNRGTGLYLDGLGSTTNGDDVGQWANTTHQNAQWSLQQYSGSYYRLQNRGTGLYLDGMGRTTNGDAVGQWANSGSQNAQWQMINVGSTFRVAAGTAELLDRKALAQEVLDQPETILFFPNPMNDVLNIRLEDNDGSAVAKIFNVSGQIVISRQLTELDNKIEVRNLQDGIYFVEVATGSGTSRSKLIK